MAESVGFEPTAPKSAAH